MISVRAEGLPAFGVDNLDMTALHTLNISIFPEANYQLQVQITRDLQMALHEYFSMKPEEKEKEKKVLGTDRDRDRDSSANSNSDPSSSSTSGAGMESDSNKLSRLFKATQMNTRNSESEK